MSLEIAWKQNILVKDSNLLKLLLVVLGFGSQTFICGFSRQNICSVEQDITKCNLSEVLWMNGYLIVTMVIKSHPLLWIEKIFGRYIKQPCFELNVMIAVFAAGRKTKQAKKQSFWRMRPKKSAVFFGWPCVQQVEN